MEKYRFDDVWEKVFEYNHDAGYVFIGSYYAFGITADMTYEDKAQIVYEDMMNNDVY